MASRDDVVRYAYRFVGVPYKWGGDDLEHGVDCSGLIRCVLQRFDLLPSGDFNSQMLYDQYSSCEVEQFAPGNIVFFGRDTNRIHHVAICVDRKRMIEAAGGNAKTRTLGMALARKAAVVVSDINRRDDRVAIVDPFSMEG